MKAVKMVGFVVVFAVLSIFVVTFVQMSGVSEVVNGEFVNTAQPWYVHLVRALFYFSWAVMFICGIASLYFETNFWALMLSQGINSFLFYLTIVFAGFGVFLLLKNVWWGYVIGIVILLSALASTAKYVFSTLHTLIMCVNGNEN